ncbi:hypothetical protein L195_g009987 [Trifolium pratense]|uniref:Uncharacterized protein n=1 Tax=Trifolium pratense TaxID=57577 RepID=A0A2K3PDL7_TRIPR|nr:hypothetical protein L195_g009987 [Trifolium pratense]
MHTHPSANIFARTIPFITQAKITISTVRFYHWSCPFYPSRAVAPYVGLSDSLVYRVRNRTMKKRSRLKRQKCYRNGEYMAAVDWIRADCTDADKKVAAAKYSPIK